jgi:hypothetical protein
MFVGMTPSDEPSMRKRRVSDRPVRFLFAPAANDHKFLMALDEQSGEPQRNRTDGEVDAFPNDWILESPTVDETRLAG